MDEAGAPGKHNQRLDDLKIKKDVERILLAIQDLLQPRCGVGSGALSSSWPRPKAKPKPKPDTDHGPGYLITEEVPKVTLQSHSADIART
jgi:hypothetical protein